MNWGILGRNFSYPSDKPPDDHDKKTNGEVSEPTNTEEFHPPPNRVYQDPDPNDEYYDELMTILLAKVKRDILADFPQAFGDSLTKNMNPTSELV